MWNHVPPGTRLEQLLDLIDGLGGRVENYSANGYDDWYKIWNPEGNEFHHFRASDELAIDCRTLSIRLSNMKGVKKCLPPLA